MEGRLYLRLLLRHWLAALTAVLVCLAAGAALYLRASPTYESTEVISIEAASRSQDPSELYSGVLLAQVRAVTFKDLITGPGLAQRLASRVPGIDTRRIERDLAASVSTGSVLISITITDSSRPVVRALANALAVEFPGYVQQMQTRAASTVVTAVVVGSPQSPRQTRPSKVKYAGLGLLGGVLLAFALCVLLELRNRALRDVDDVRAVVSGDTAVVDLRRVALHKHRAHPQPARTRRVSRVALRRKSSNQRETRWAFELSTLAAAAEVANRPLALVPLRDDGRVAMGILDIAQLLARGRRPVALIDSSGATSRLSTLAATLTNIGVQTGTELAASRRLHADTGLVLVTPTPDVGDAVSIVKSSGGVALIAGAAVVQQPLTTQGMHVALLVVAGVDTKAELRATVDLVSRLDRRLSAVVLVAPTPVRR